MLFIALSQPVRTKATCELVLTGIFVQVVELHGLCVQYDKVNNMVRCCDSCFAHSTMMWDHTSANLTLDSSFCR